MFVSTYATIMNVADNYLETDNYILKRENSSEKTIVYVKGKDGAILHTIVNYNGAIFVDNIKLCETGYIRQSLNINEFATANSGRSGTIKWEAWQDMATQEIETGGLTSAVIAGVIAAAAPWVGVRVAASVAAAVAGKYDTVTISGKIRYGGDQDDIGYYERKTYFYGDGKLIKGPVTDSGVLD